jgi:hypothetical protein
MASLETTVTVVTVWPIFFALELLATVDILFPADSTLL